MNALCKSPPYRDMCCGVILFPDNSVVHVDVIFPSRCMRIEASLIGTLTGYLICG